MNMQTISFPAYPDILRWGSRGVLAALLGAMPWAALSPAADRLPLNLLFLEN